MPVSIEKMLVVSTSHLREATANLLNSEAEEAPPFCNIMEEGWGPAFVRDAGWIFYVSPLAENGEPDEPENLPPELSKLFMFARENGCEWVMLDSDGPELDELEAFVW